MRFAFTSFSCPSLSLDALLRLAGRLGYDGIELRVGYGHRHGVEINASARMRARLRTLVESAGPEICAAGSLVELLHADDLTPTYREIDLAGDIGSPILRVFGGPIPGETRFDAALKRVRDRLLRLAEHGATRGVLVAVETHDHWARPDLMADLMTSVDHPAAAVIWDIMHTQRDGGVAASSAHVVLAPWIVHAHAHDGVDLDGELELRPIGSGDIDHLRPFELLCESGFSGFVSGEWIGWDGDQEHLARELATMRRFADISASTTG